MVGTPIGIRPTPTDERSIPDWGAWAESSGFDRVWVSEGWGTNAFVTLAAIAERTESIGLGTAIVNVYSRTPALLAMSARSLVDLAGDRFVLGLGVSHPQIVESLHGHSYDRPLRRMAETVELVGAFTGEDAVEFDGDVFDVSGFDGLDVEVPIYNAALGPVNRRLTGELCDGWLPYNVPLTELEDAFETVESAATAAGRDPGDVTVAPWVPVAVSDDVDAARDVMRENLAWYIGNYGAYRRAVARTFPEVEDVASAWQRGDHADAVRSLQDETLDALSIVDTPDAARERFRALCERPFVDAPVLVTPRRAGDDVVQRTYAELSPDRL